MRHQDQETKLLNKTVSPRRLRGGAAILRVVNKNHHIAILGIKLIKPLLMKRLGLPKRSQEMLERQKKKTSRTQTMSHHQSKRSTNPPKKLKVIIPQTTILIK